LKTTNWKDITELIGIAAIVASLLFVGLQMKQSHEIVLAEIYQARTATVMDWNHTLATSDLALSAFEKSATGQFDEINPMERRATSAMIMSALYAYENSHYQHTLGFVSQEHWDRARSTLALFMQDPIWREQILANTGILRPSFRQVIEEIAAETPGEIR
jgi:hypothetical protein